MTDELFKLELFEFIFWPAWLKLSEGSTKLLKIKWDGVFDEFGVVECPENTFDPFWFAVAAAGVIYAFGTNGGLADGDNSFPRVITIFLLFM